MIAFLIIHVFVAILSVAGEVPCEQGQQMLLNGTCVTDNDGPCPTIWKFRENLSKARSQLEAVRAMTCEEGGKEACWECQWDSEPAGLHEKLQEVLNATRALSNVWQSCSATTKFTFEAAKSGLPL